jgi:acyl-CoA synthetase (AMP-forming)/AMP-acid ligase II
VHDLTVADVVREHRRSRADTVALVDGETRVTYRELDRRTDRLANAMSAAGVGEGDRILWLGVNSFRILELLVAASKIGAMVCPANWRQSEDELDFILHDLEPALVVWEQGPQDQPLARLRQHSTARWICHNGSTDQDYEAWLTAAPADVPDTAIGDDAPLLLLYTAAFDGHPNAAMLASRALISHGLVLGLLRQVEEGFVCLDSGPLFHIGTMMFAMSTLVLGGTNVVVPTFEPELVCALIEREKCQSAMLFPAMIEQLVAVNADRRFDLSSLRFAPAGDEWNSMITIDDSPWGRSFAGYGQTEVGGMLTFHGLGLSGLGPAGRPSPLTQVRIVGPDDQDVPDGQIGELVARGTHLFSGYFRRPELSARKARGGWHHTGDLGRREADGTLTFLGPKLRMIKSGGENVYPAEVERALASHPDVAAAAVIGVPDDTWGQNVAAIVVRKPEAAVDADALVGHVRTRIASYKKPKSIVFVDEIPRRGFVPDYDLLDATYGGGGYPGS